MRRRCQRRCTTCDAQDEPVERLDLGTEQFCRALLGPLLQAATGTDVS